MREGEGEGERDKDTVMFSFIRHVAQVYMSGGLSASDVRSVKGI